MPSPESNPEPTPFIPRRLDEQGLTASQFRVYCHVARRAGRDGSCFSSLRTMATVCRLDIKTIQACLAQLVEIRMLRLEKSPGKTNTFFLTSPIEWIAPNPNATTPEGHYTQIAPHPIDTVGVTPNRTAHPTQTAPYEVNPTKLNPNEGSLMQSSAASAVLEELKKKRSRLQQKFRRRSNYVLSAYGYSNKPQFDVTREERQMEEIKRELEAVEVEIKWRQAQ